MSRVNIIATILFFSSTLFAVGVIVVTADDASTAVEILAGPPGITNITFNGGFDVVLNEGTSKTATVTITTFDPSGCDNVATVTASIYRTPTATEGTACAQDDNNCYPKLCTENPGTCTGPGDLGAVYSCVYNVWYIADPTDTGAFAGDIWTAAATATDALGNPGDATNTGETIEVVSLSALDVSSPLAYGTVFPGTNTGVTNSTSTITNTGNIALDIDLSGSHMCTDYPTCGPGDVPPTLIATTSQEYALDPFDFDVGGTDLTGSAVEIETDGLVKPTATTTAIIDLISWGLEVALGTPSGGGYTGLTTFLAKLQD